MIKLLVVADDFTGALDTGVKLAEQGVRTAVVRDDADFLGMDAEAAVADAESRHMTAKGAGETVFRIVSAAKAAGASYFYKKTDSALRGNIAAELSAMRAASGVETLYFMPAYPAMNRVTKGGVQFIDGAPAAESVFGSDPFEPVKTSSVREMFRGDPEPVSLAASAEEMTGVTGVQVVDAASDGDLGRIAERLGQMGASVFAGCAGFAAFLPRLIPFCKKAEAMSYGLFGGIFAVSGSVNPVTLRQLDDAEQSGIPVLTMPEAVKWNAGEKTDKEKFVRTVKDAFSGGRRAAVCSVRRMDDCRFPADMEPEAARALVADSVGKMTSTLMRALSAVPFLIGGDGLGSFLKAEQVKEIRPVKELFFGVVLSECVTADHRSFPMITKSGGFGERGTIRRTMEYAKGWEKDR